MNTSFHSPAFEMITREGVTLKSPPATRSPLSGREVRTIALWWPWNPLSMPANASWTLSWRDWASGLRSARKTAKKGPPGPGKVRGGQRVVPTMDELSRLTEQEARAYTNPYTDPDPPYPRIPLYGNGNFLIHPDGHRWQSDGVRWVYRGRQAQAPSPGPEDEAAERFREQYYHALTLTGRPVAGGPASAREAAEIFRQHCTTDTRTFGTASPANPIANVNLHFDGDAAPTAIAVTMDREEMLNRYRMIDEFAEQDRNNFSTAQSMLLAQRQYNRYASQMSAQTQERIRSYAYYLGTDPVAPQNPNPMTDAQPDQVVVPLGQLPQGVQAPGDPAQKAPGETTSNLSIVQRIRQYLAR